MSLFREVYFFKADALASQIRIRAVTETIALKHLIVSSMLFGIGYEIPLSVGFSDSDLPLYDYLAKIVLFVLSAAIAYYGIWLCYQTNTKGDGKDFFLRFVALSLPVGLQLAVLFLAVALLLTALSQSLATQLGVLGGLLSNVLWYLASLTFQILFFYRIKYCMQVAAGSGA